jgi:hypothetical protein
MRNGHVVLATFVLLVAACSCFNRAFSQTQLTSGIYEGLMLAVDQHGAVSGYYRESQGSGVTKTCSFYLSGQEEGAQVNLLTWSIETFPGSLQAAEQGVVLRIEKGRDHPGCGSVLPPVISQGLLLDRIAVANWTSLRRVIAKKTFLFPKPDKKAKSRTYVVMGDLVGVFSQSGDWLRVEYVNGPKRVGGWIAAADAVELQPPR